MNTEQSACRHQNACEPMGLFRRQKEQTYSRRMLDMRIVLKHTDTVAA